MKLIYLFGQPGSGKTTLASRLNVVLRPAFCIDGDEIRGLTGNKDYTITGRIENVEFAHRLALLATKQHMNVIISLVSPYAGLRDAFKLQCIEQNISPVFVYLHYDTSLDKRGREQNWVPDIEGSFSTNLQLNTSMKTIGACVDRIIKEAFSV